MLTRNAAAPTRIEQADLRRVLSRYQDRIERETGVRPSDSASIRALADSSYDAPALPPALLDDVRRVLRQLGYTPIARDEIVFHLRHYGSLRGCESLESEDFATVAGLLPGPTYVPQVGNPEDCQCGSCRLETLALQIAGEDIIGISRGDL